MSILNALNKIKSKTNTERIMLPNGMWSIADSVFDCHLFRLGVPEKQRKELMKLPVGERDGILNAYDQ